MAVLFGRDEKTIRKHINNALKEELEESNNTQKMRVDGVKQLVLFYTLDVVISVGYRVKSKRGVEFRRWANLVLKNHVIKGYTINQSRINQLGEIVRVMRRVEEQIDSKQVLSVIERYNAALDLLDGYDHQNLQKPKGNKSIYVHPFGEIMSIT